MYTSKHKLLPLFLCLFLTYQGIAQHTEIQHASNAANPHLLLTETTSGFSRLSFDNTQKGLWSLSARNGASTNDFNIFYSPDDLTGFNIINIDADDDVINMNAEVDVVNHDLRVSGTDPDLILSSSGTNDPAILFGDNGASNDGRIWFDTSDDHLNLAMSSTTFPDLSISGENGRVGINEDNNLEAQLTVKANAGNTVIPAHLELRENNNGEGGRLRMTNSNAGYWEIHGDSNGTVAGELDFIYNNGSTTTTIARMDGDNNRVGIRDATPEYTLSVDFPAGSPNNGTPTGSATINGSRFGLNLQNTSNNDSWTFYTSSSAGGGDLRIYYDFNTTDIIDPVLRGTFNNSNGAYTNSSDVRLKKNISNLDNQLDKVLQLRPTKYQFKTQKGNSYSLGLIAQEVEKVIPDVVHQITNMEEDGTDYLGIEYTSLVPVLVGAIQDQQDIINGQKSEIDAVKAELAEIKKILKTIK